MPQQQVDRVNKPLRPEEIAADPNHHEEETYEVVHKTEIILCYVRGNDLGDRYYGLYIEDQEGLPRSIGVEMRISPDRSIGFIVDGGLNTLYDLKPELFEQPEMGKQLERENDEDFWHPR